MPTMFSEELAGVADWLVGRVGRRAGGMVGPGERHCGQDRGIAG